MRVLPTMTIRTFRLKIIKFLKIPKNQQRNMSLWLKFPDETLSEIKTDGHDDSYDLAWWGMEDGADVVVHVDI